MWDAGALGVASRHEVGHPVVAGSSVLIATSLPSVGALVSGSPSQYDHRCSPVSALIAKREDRARLGVMRSAAEKARAGVCRVGQPSWALVALVPRRRDGPQCRKLPAQHSQRSLVS
jgi:hypothetical protein